jgi:hypothetical protein
MERWLPSRCDLTSASPLEGEVDKASALAGGGYCLRLRDFWNQSPNVDITPHPPPLRGADLPLKGRGEVQFGASL